MIDAYPLWRRLRASDHLVQLARAALHLSERSRQRGLGRWVHMLGFRGHFVTSPAATPPPWVSCATHAPPTAPTRTPAPDNLDDARRLAQARPRPLFESADGQWRIANPHKLTTELRHRWLVAERRTDTRGWNLHDGDHATLHDACAYVRTRQPA